MLELPAVLGDGLVKGEQAKRWVLAINRAPRIDFDIVISGSPEQICTRIFGGELTPLPFRFFYEIFRNVFGLYQFLRSQGNPPHVCTPSPVKAEWFMGLDYESGFAWIEYLNNAAAQIKLLQDQENLLKDEYGELISFFRGIVESISLLPGRSPSAKVNVVVLSRIVYPPEVFMHLKFNSSLLQDQMLDLLRIEGSFPPLPDVIYREPANES